MYFHPFLILQDNSRFFLYQQYFEIQIPHLFQFMDDEAYQENRNMPVSQPEFRCREQKQALSSWLKLFDKNIQFSNPGIKRAAILSGRNLQEIKQIIAQSTKECKYKVYEREVHRKRSSNYQNKSLKDACMSVLFRKVIVLAYAERINTDFKKQFYFDLIENTRTPLILIHTQIRRTSELVTRCIDIRLNSDAPMQNVQDLSSNTGIGSQIISLQNQDFNWEQFLKQKTLNVFIDVSRTNLLRDHGQPIIPQSKQLILCLEEGQKIEADEKKEQKQLQEGISNRKSYIRRINKTLGAKLNMKFKCLLNPTVRMICIKIHQVLCKSNPDYIRLVQILSFNNVPTDYFVVKMQQAFKNASLSHLFEQIPVQNRRQFVNLCRQSQQQE